MRTNWNAWNSWHGGVESDNASSDTDWNTCNWKRKRTHEEEEKQSAWKRQRKNILVHVSTSNFDASKLPSQPCRSTSPRRVIKRGLFPDAPWEKSGLRDGIESFLDESHTAASNTDWNTCNSKDDSAWKTSSNDSHWDEQEEHQLIALEHEAVNNQSAVFARNFDASSSSTQRLRSRSPRRVVNRQPFSDARREKTWLRDRTGSFFDGSHNATSHTASNTCNWKDEFAGKTLSNDSYWENQEAQKQIALEPEAGSNQSSVSASIFDASSSSSERWRNCSARPVVTRGLFPGAPWDKPWLRDRIGRSFFDESHYATSPTAVNACNRKDEFEWKTSSNDIYWENEEERRQITSEPEAGKNQSSVSASNFNDNFALSKALNKMLRYKVSELGLAITNDGFSSLAAIYQALDRYESWEEVVRCLKQSRHQDGSLRFELKQDPSDASNIMVKATRMQSSKYIG